MRRYIIVCLSLPLLLLAAPVRAEVIPFDLEIGYRWVSVRGNEAVYRTQINEQSGLFLRTFSLTSSNFGGDTRLMDRFRIDTTDLGVGPSSALRVEASKNGAYRLRLGYRAMDAFNALPAFANPLLVQGITPGQHTLERTRTMFDADLEILPDRAFTPFIGYSWNRNDGPGQTTYFVGQDEFLLRQDLRETDRELRAGTSFRFGSFYGRATQGWRRFRGTDALTLAPGAGSGNNNAPVLGQPVNATELNRTTRTSVSTPFTNVYVAGEPIKRMKIITNYVRFAAESDGLGDEGLAGSFLSFPLGLDFNALAETASGRMKNTTWRGMGRAEFAIREGIDLVASYQTEHRELDGSSLINTLYMQSATLGGINLGDVRAIVASANALNRDEDVWSAGFSARSLGPFAVRAEFRQSQQDFDVAPDLSEIVVPGSQGGVFQRRIRTFDTGGTYTSNGFTFLASWRRDRANTPVFRTDFLDRDRYRARAGWASTSRKFSAGISAEQIDQENQSEIGFDSKLRQYTGEVEFAPIAKLRLRAGGSKFRADTNILFRRPENFTIDSSVHEENGTSREGGVALLFAKGTLDAGFTRFTNTGNVAFDIDRYRLRGTLNLKAHTGLAAEWNKDQYRESTLALSNFNAARYGIYFRWTP